MRSLAVQGLATDGNTVVPFIARSISAGAYATKSPLTPSILGVPASASATTSLGINE